jgi:hypothetical protein
MIVFDMDGLLWLVESHHQSGTMMPSGAVHPIIPGAAAMIGFSFMPPRDVDHPARP